MIPMVDLEEQYRQLKSEIDAGLLAALQSAQFILGPNVRAFEQEAAAYLGVEHAIGCASGTDALHLALIAAGIEPGDEVITPAFTFIATAEAIRYAGAEPVFVDNDPDTYNIDPAQVEVAIGSKTRAVLPVHLFGQPADMEALNDLCEKRGLVLIEDCAQSFGANIRGRQTGGFGAFGCFSFFPSKNLGGYGDGGLITTNDEKAAVTLRALRNHGSHTRYHHERIGYNSRLDELQAVVLRVKLKYIDEYNENRRRVAHLYDELLADSPVKTPYERPGGHHVYHQYTVLTPERDRLMAHLKEAGIASAIYYPIPLHRQQAFANDYRHVHLPVTEQICAQCLSLPIYPELKNEAVARIAAVIRESLLG